MYPLENTAARSGQSLRRNMNNSARRHIATCDCIVAWREAGDAAVKTQPGSPYARLLCSRAMRPRADAATPDPIANAIGIWRISVNRNRFCAGAQATKQRRVSFSKNNSERSAILLSSIDDIRAARETAHRSTSSIKNIGRTNCNLLTLRTLRRKAFPIGHGRRL